MKLTTLARALGVFLAVVISCSGTFSQTNFWQSLNGPFSGPSNLIAISPSGSIYASNWSNNLYKSSDSGRTWQQKYFANQAYVTALAISHSGHIFVATVYYPSQNFLFRSTDDGNSWNTMMNRHILSLGIDPKGVIFACGVDSGIYRSSNNGESWLNSGFNETNTWVPYITCDQAGTIYADVFTTGGGRIYRSSDSGNNWEPTDRTSYNVQVVVARSENFLFSGGDSGVVISSDRGISWRKTFYDSGAVTAMAFDSSGGLYIASKNTVYYSADSGKSWNRGSPIFGAVNTLQTDVAGSLYAGGDFSVLKSTDRGMTWFQVGTKRATITALLVYPEGNIITPSLQSSDNGEHWTVLQNGSECFALNHSDGKMYSGGNVTVSSDSGRNWQNLDLYGHIIESFAIGRTGILFAGSAYDGVFRSLDTGKTWLPSPVFDYYMNALAIDTMGNIYATSEYGVYKSVDTGKTWIPTSLSTYRIRTLTIDPFGNIFVGTSSTIFRSSDGGDTWIQTNLPYNYVNALAIGQKGEIFAGTSGNGVYVSTDLGETWVMKTGGLKTSDFNGYAWIYSLAISPDNYLYAGTEDGVYRSIGPITNVKSFGESIPISFNLSQNYPNPFNPSTTIEFSLPHTEFVTLKVYDLLGQEVATLAAEQLSPGTYTRTWNAENSTSGIYFYRLQTAQFSETKKLVLIK